MTKVTNDTNDSQAVTGGDITKYRTLCGTHQVFVTRSSRSQVCGIAKYDVWWQNSSASDLERVKRIGRYLVGKPRAECLFHWQQSGELEACSDADWRGDNVTRRSVSVGVIRRGGHGLKVWTKKQQVMSLCTAESELYAAAKTASEG